MTSRPRRRWWRALLLAGAGLAWTGLVCYPNPAVLARNLLRYRRFPISPRLEQRMGWQLPRHPGEIENFVDSLHLPTPDWRVYRVPWYVPTALEAAQARHGDCESKAVVLASLLAGKQIPFRLRASFNHIWVDYPGRQPRPGEEPSAAYLEGTGGRLGLRRPGQVDWAKVLATQRAQLWDAMPLARKALWLLGLGWLGLGALLVGGAAPTGDFASRWRVHLGRLATRAGWIGAALLGLLAAAPWPQAPAPWSLPATAEAAALSAMAGAFLAWATVLRPKRAVAIADDREQIIVISHLGAWRSQRQIAVSDIAHLQLDGSGGGLQPQHISAVLHRGARVPLAHYHQELAARAALRGLAIGLNRAMVVHVDGWVGRTDPDEIAHSLRERAAQHPAAAVLPRPPGCDLVTEDSGQVWRMRHPAAGCGWLFVLGLAPVLLASVFTLAVLRKPWIIPLWVGWVIAMAFLGLCLYVALMVAGEVVARLAGVRVEIEQGELKFHTPERKVERMALTDIESVELGRVGETPTVAVVSLDRVLHLRDLCPGEHRQWARQQVEQAILRAN